jgi:hypothetical protein
MCMNRPLSRLATRVAIAVDETVVPVLDPGRGCTKKGYFWAIARDDRAWAGSDPPAVAYSYRRWCVNDVRSA